jgi:hypothetical protein
VTPPAGPGDDAPIVIGALGGSGTRVPAQALIDSGAFLGAELNRARDNLVFTALFRRPRWAGRAGDARIHRQLDTFVRYMRGGRYGPADYARLAGALVDHDRERGLRGSGAKVWGAVAHRPAPPEARAPVWGWKEPNSHVFLPQLIDRFPGLRYVYMVRHGLDMAHSRNKRQLRVWGDRFGVAAPPAGDPAAEARAQLDFWIAVTRRALELGSRLGERFIVVRYEDLCDEPQRELGRVLELAGLDVGAERISRLAAQVRRPDSAGRWRERGTGQFSAAQLAAVESLGFDVD